MKIVSLAEIMLFISQIRKSEKQNTQAQMKQNAFDGLRQKAVRGPYDHWVKQPFISLLLSKTFLLSITTLKN